MQVSCLYVKIYKIKKKKLYLIYLCLYVNNVSSGMKTKKEIEVKHMNILTIGRLVQVLYT